MANNKEVFKVWRSYGTGTGGYRRLEPMTEAESAAWTAIRQQAQRESIDRQIAEDAYFQVESPPPELPKVGCVNCAPWPGRALGYACISSNATTARSRGMPSIPEKIPAGR